MWAGFGSRSYGFGYEPNVEWTSCGSLFLPENQADPNCARDSGATVGTVAGSLVVSVAEFGTFVAARTRLAARPTNSSAPFAEGVA
jgi:hypothetical protein